MASVLSLRGEQLPLFCAFAASWVTRGHAPSRFELVRCGFSVDTTDACYRALIAARLLECSRRKERPILGTIRPTRWAMHQLEGLGIVVPVRVEVACG